MKKILLLSIVAMLLVGCGNTDNKNNEKNTQPTETEKETTHTHAYTEAITTEATCEADGVKTFTCECGDSYTEPIKASGHDYEDVISAPTCTEKGYTTHTCKTCGNAYTDTEVSASGHSYGGYTYNNDATYEKDGTETATCSVCGNKNTRTKKGTKLVKEEPDEPVQPDEPGECPVAIHQIVDEGNRIYFWTSLHGGLNGTEYQNQKQAVMEEALALAATKWGGFKRTNCTQHVWWGTRELCLIEIFPPN